MITKPPQDTCPCAKTPLRASKALIAAIMVLAAAGQTRASVVITYNTGGAGVYEPYDNVVSATDAANSGSTVLSSLSLTAGSALYGSSASYMNDGVVYNPSTMNDRGNTTWTLTPTDGAQLTINFSSGLNLAVINTFAMSGSGQARSAQDYKLEYFASGSWTSLFTNLNTSAPNNIDAGNTTTWVNLDLTGYAGGALSSVEALRFTFYNVSGDESMYREVDVFTTGTFWAPSAGGGGTGTWSAGVNNWASAAATQGYGLQSTATTLLFGNASGTVTVSGGVSVAAGMTFSTDGYTVTNSTITLTGGNAASNTITTAASVGATVASQLAGANGMTKAGTGTLTFGGSAANTLIGTTIVSAGTLELNKAASTTAIAGNLEVATGATLLLSQSHQVNNSATVTLSGGTITRGSGVSEVVGSLNLTAASSLDFGTGATGSMTFGIYEENATPSALLTLNNFMPGNSFTFSNALFAANGSNIGSYFSFGTGYINSSIIDNGGSSFTITAIPEPSTVLAALGLAGLMLWPAAKQLRCPATSTRKG
jgi:autotransporter-associated beta strand protein